MQHDWGDVCAGTRRGRRIQIFYGWHWLGAKFSWKFCRFVSDVSRYEWSRPVKHFDHFWQSGVTNLSHGKTFWRRRGEWDDDPRRRTHFWDYPKLDRFWWRVLASDPWNSPQRGFARFTHIRSLRSQGTNLGQRSSVFNVKVHTHLVESQS